jgi:hypothetical protein
VESDWFRARGRALARPDGPTRAPAPPPAAGPPGGAAAWSSPGDDGWRAAAAAVLAPASSGTTTAGLPRRTPQANLVPGSAGARPPRPPRPPETPEVARSRLAGFQRGSLRARAAVQGRDGES